MKDDATFLALHERSHVGVLAVALHLCCTGEQVLLPPIHTRPDVTQRDAYRDHGDLKSRTPGAPWLRHEVRWAVATARDARFETLADYAALGLGDVLVEPVASFDAKQPPPDLFWRLNAALTHAVVVDIDATREFWEKRDTRSYNTDRAAYFCPVETCTFTPLRKG